MTPQDLREFLMDIDREFKVGIDRPRLLVRHVKKGRSHFHVAISEVDPASMRVLDCRKDFARLEALARRYEQSHAETVQSTRSKRRLRKTEGFSDTARKRAERIAPEFDRTALRLAFASGMEDFRAELRHQGLTVKQGHKCPVIVRPDGAFVAAAHRACGVRKHLFIEAIKEASKADACTPVGKRPPRPAAVFRTPRLRSLENEMWALTHLGKFDPDDLLRRALDLAEALFGGNYFRHYRSRPKPISVEDRHGNTQRQHTPKGPRR